MEQSRVAFQTTNQAQASSDEVSSAQALSQKATSTQKLRLYKWDNIKFFLIFCVVLGHIAAIYGDNSYSLRCAQFWLYLFHMPGFIFISGLFAKRTIQNKKWSKVIPYLVLYLIMELLEYLVAGSIKGFSNTSFDPFHEVSVPWFALAMFWCYSVTILIRNVHPVVVFPISIALSFSIGYADNITSFLVLNRSIVFYPFFYLGYVLSIEKLSLIMKRKSLIALSAFVIIASLLIVFLKFDSISYWINLFRGRYAYSAIGAPFNAQWGGLWRLCFYAISTLMIFSICTIVPELKTPFAWLGKRTLSTFAFHNPILKLLFIKWEAFGSFFASTGHIGLCSLVVCLVVVIVTSLFDCPLRKLLFGPSQLIDKHRLSQAKKE